MPDVPILGQPKPQQFSDDSIGSIVNLYDSEFLAAEKLWRFLQGKFEQKHVDRDSMHQEIIDRFRDIGLRVRINWFQGGVVNDKGVLEAVPNLYVPELSIQSRVETKGQFDHDKMAWEVQNNILELPGVEKGKISMNAAEAQAFMKSHSGHGHEH